ncbi:MAG: HEAT repeat domain-containing protein [Pseudohongiellaceae bacterium]
MPSLYEQFLSYNPDSSEYRFLVTLSLSVLVLFGLSLLFAVIAMSLRLHNFRQEKLWQNLYQLWNRDMLEVLSGDTSPTEFRKLVAPHQELNFIRFLAPYVWRLRGSDLNTLSSLGLPYLPHVVNMLQHREIGVRLWAVNIISQFGMPQYEATILKAFQDESPVVAMFAANALLRLGHARYVVPVLDQFHRFDKWGINSMATLLSSVGHEAIPLLRQIYLDPVREPRTRVVAAEVLNRFCDYGVADDAAALLDSTGRLDLLIATLRLLSTVGQEKHRAAVHPLCSSSNDAIRVNAVRTLRQLCIADDLPLFIAALDDSSPWVARQAARALKLLGDTATLERMSSGQHPRAMLASQILAGKD